MPLFMILAALVLVLPVALAVGGHNGATALGVCVVLAAIILTVLTSPTRSKK